MVPLPIDALLPEVTARLRQTRSLVLVAEPGAGKTTRVPPAILRANLLDPLHPNLVLLQPRRIAARTVAARIADETGVALGREVGYHVRFDRQLTASTRLRVLTEGILTRQLLDDPFLEGIGAVVLDEFHERSLFTDIAVALLREVQQTVRPDLIIVVMSATLDAKPVAAYLDDCPIVQAPGRTFPVHIAYSPGTSALPARMADAITLATRQFDDGHILAFLPGEDEIRRTASQLASALNEPHLVLPLYGNLPPAEQSLALRPPPRGQRKIVLATNIAETSLTIDGITTVIDSGLARVASFDPERGLDRLDLARISKASAAQRAGRAGRTAPGRCIRLWSEKEQQAMADFDLPEILRVDLASTVLSLHAWGKADVRQFAWFQPPDDSALQAAERLLHSLGALRGEASACEITPLGRQVVNVPVHPRLARLLWAAGSQGLLLDGAALAALISEKDIAVSHRQPALARGPAVLGSSDLIYRLQLLEQAERDRFSPHLLDQGIDPIAARKACQARDELARIGRHLQIRQPRQPEESDLLNLTLQAYPDRVCRRRESDPSAAIMTGGVGVRLAAESTVRRPDFFAAIDPRHDPRSATREALVRIASSIDVRWLGELFPDSVRTERGVEYDPQRKRVTGVLRHWYLDLLLSEDRNTAVDPEQAAAALAVAVRPMAADLIFGDEPALQLLHRVQLLRTAMPEHPWPDFSSEQLADLLADHCAGKRSIEDLHQAGLSRMLLSRLPYPLDRLLEQHAPTEVEVPTGNRIRLDYQAGQPPVLAVRLQELFGMGQTPLVAAGRVRVRLHLLGPNYRPVQITDDLANFWKVTYFQVRKDLRARYPKHSWPDDPMSAPAVARGRPRRSSAG